jgi:ankyrin repeat protein
MAVAVTESWKVLRPDSQVSIGVQTQKTLERRTGTKDMQRFSQAVWQGNLPEVEAMIAAGADVNAADEPHDPPLHLAIEQQWTEVVRRLIQAGANVNRDLGNGWSPLVHAIDIESDAASQAGRLPDEVSTELVALLLAAGARPTEEAAAGPLRAELRERTLVLAHQLGFTDCIQRLENASVPSGEGS